MVGVLWWLGWVLWSWVWVLPGASGGCGLVDFFFFVVVVAAAAAVVVCVVVMVVYCSEYIVLL